MNKLQQHITFAVSFVVFNALYISAHLQEGVGNAVAQSLGAFVVFFLCGYVLLMLAQVIAQSVLGMKLPPKSHRHSI